MIRRPPRSTRTDIPTRRSSDLHGGDHGRPADRHGHRRRCRTAPATRPRRRRRPDRVAAADALYHAGDRSEEHTSELQSLMRISYAVFCLKKKNTINTHMNIHTKHTHTNCRTLSKLPKYR